MSRPQWPYMADPEDAWRLLLLTGIVALAVGSFLFGFAVGLA